MYILTYDEKQWLFDTLEEVKICVSENEIDYPNVVYCEVLFKNNSYEIIQDIEVIEWKEFETSKIRTALCAFMGFNETISNKTLKNEIKLLENNGEEIVTNVAEQYNLDETDIENYIENEL